MKRILIIRIDFLGDMTCTTAFMRALKQHWPHAEIHVLANKYNRAVLEGNPDISAIHTYVYSKDSAKNVRPGKLNAIFGRLSLILHLRRLKFDLLVVPNGGMNKNGIQFARQLNAKDCRWHDADSEFDDRKPDHVANRPIRHEVLSGFALMPELKRTDIDALKLYAYPDPALQASRASELGPRIKPRVGLFVSNKAAERRWDLHKWSRLADALSERAEVLIFRDPADAQSSAQPTCRAARSLAPATVSDMIAAMSLLDLIVSADSAPVHLGSALQLPIVALFENRPEKYLRWHPLGTRHILLHAGARVDDIAFETVEKAVGTLLAELAPAHPSAQ
ncbi:glycosyltransferase family 9 protein [Trinickia violacea]|uniref:Glycosyltransferase family 9 protein n=1 Tax=Trinickia violacea TaxID=2571746 RepID=A0A4P8IWM3_9BURK|nr:glycosyltransferase family 9 protein [Trinickia violacea]